MGISERISALRLNETALFPVEKLTTVRTLSSNLGLVLDRKFKTRVIRAHRQIEVKRII